MKDDLGTSHLVSEIARHKDQPEKSPHAIQPRSLHDAGEVTDESSAADTENSGRLVAKYNELGKKYQDLEQQVKYLKRKNSAVMQKNKDMKESVRAWQEYADRQSWKQKAQSESKLGEILPRLSAVPQIEDHRPQIPSSPRSITTARIIYSPTEAECSSPAPAIPPVQSEQEALDRLSASRLDDYPAHEKQNRRESTMPKPLTDSEAQRVVFTDHVEGPASDNPTNNLGRQYLQSTHPSSSQTTVDEATQQALRRTQAAIVTEEDDWPQFVSTRSVNKRKRGHPTKIEVYGECSDGTPVKPYRVKEEPGSSPPNIYTLIRKDTIDLDAPTAGLLQTPRHNRYQRSSSVPFTLRIKSEEAAEASVALDMSGTINTDVQACSEVSNQIGVENSVLRHLDPNTVMKSDEERSNKRVKHTNASSAHGHSIFSESGEEVPPPNRSAIMLAPSVARAKINRQLHSSICPHVHPVPAFRTIPPTTTNVKLESDIHIPSAVPGVISGSMPRNPQPGCRWEARGSPANDDRPQWRTKASETPPRARKPSAILPRQPSRQERLRTRPMDELKAHDFRPNPAFNQGYSSAFSETVRKRGDRMCLPGCTKPDCCGSTFRAFARAQAPLSSAEEEILLEEYLGEAYDNMRLTQMATEERQELVLQARTRKLAKETGKHREPFERRRSPPGFWRVDFPSTQEQQEDREKAMDQEKKLVEERWLEAQRGGGRWIFRDE